MVNGAGGGRKAITQPPGLYKGNTKGLIFYKTRELAQMQPLNGMSN